MNCETEDPIRTIGIKAAEEYLRNRGSINALVVRFVIKETYNFLCPQIEQMQIRGKNEFQNRG